ncbi:MAG TPA: hypothetical protein VFG47_23845, partial [Geminicoccaceae bacterium]|nr:hypothetical protein [Geminicoccaceae bacterium]
EAALALQRAHGLAAAAIERIEVHTFREAVRLAARLPATTEEAQYSLPFPVAAALVRGGIGPAEVGAAGLADLEVRRLSAATELIEDTAYSRRFPAERWARVGFVLRDGRRLASPPATARGDPGSPLDDGELVAKYRHLTVPVLGMRRSARLESAVAGLADGSADLAPFSDDLLGAAVGRGARPGGRERG